MKRTIRSYVMGLLGIGMAVVSYASKEGFDQISEINPLAVSLWGVIIGGTIAFLSQNPADAKWDDEEGE